MTTAPPIYHQVHKKASKFEILAPLVIWSSLNERDGFWTEASQVTPCAKAGTRTLLLDSSSLLLWCLHLRPVGARHGRLTPARAWAASEGLAYPRPPLSGRLPAPPRRDARSSWTLLHASGWSTPTATATTAFQVTNPPSGISSNDKPQTPVSPFLTKTENAETNASPTRGHPTNSGVRAGPAGAEPSSPQRLLHAPARGRSGGNPPPGHGGRLSPLRLPSRLRRGGTGGGAGTAAAREEPGRAGPGRF